MRSTGDIRSGYRIVPTRLLQVLLCVLFLFPLRSPFAPSQNHPTDNYDPLPRASTLYASPLSSQVKWFIQPS
ncbi:hypothetical protein EDB85DRAFT_2021589 [Lactarius pseudohatsudake]|nr:hypothetical protein EDB85DRAFT_2021589 [Lactarius pseudohatsudake]